MKKTLIVSSVSFIFLVISSAVAYLLRYWQVRDAWVSLVIAIVTLGASGIVALIGSRIKWLNPLCFAVSAVALGFALRAWYIFRSFDNPFWKIILVSLGCVMYLWVYFLLARIPLLASRPAVFTSAWLILSLVAYILLVCLTTTTWVSTFGYYMLIEIAFILAMYSEVNSISELVRTLALSTFAVFGVIVFVALMMLAGDGDCDCSGCDCSCDCDLGGGSDKSAKKKPKNNATDIKP